jgi:hypothetical protein
MKNPNFPLHRFTSVFLRQKVAQAFLLFLLTSVHTVQAQQSIDLVVEDFFALVELKLPVYFPAGAETLIQDEYFYRYYPVAQTYLAVANDRVLLLGGEFGDDVIDVGERGGIVALLNNFSAPTSADWNIIISGTIYFYNAEGPLEGLLNFRSFDGLVAQGVQPPDFNDIEGMISEYSLGLEGEVGAFKVISSLVINDTPTRKTLAVNFEIPHEIGAFDYYLLYDFTR